MITWFIPKMAKTASSTKLMQWWVLGHTSPFNPVQGKILAKLYVRLRAYRMDISNLRIKQFTKVSSKSSGCHYFAVGSCGNRRGPLLGLVSFQVFLPVFGHNLFCSTADGFRSYDFFS
jgi:hypothetical protein